MKKLLSTTLLSALLISVPQKAMAHCPLCTAGAGAIAAAAMAMGISVEAIAILIGAFAAALGFFVANRIKKVYFKGQKWVVVALIFATTIIPLMPFMYVEPYSVVVYWFGEMGSPFNRVYLVDRFIVGSVLGAGIMAISPFASSALSRVRSGKKFPYQGLAVTFLLIILAALVAQLLA